MAGDLDGAEEARSARDAQAEDDAQESRQAEVSDAGCSGDSTADGTDYERPSASVCSVK